MSDKLHFGFASGCYTQSDLVRNPTYSSTRPPLCSYQALLARGTGSLSCKATSPKISQDAKHNHVLEGNSATAPPGATKNQKLGQPNDTNELGPETPHTQVPDPRFGATSPTCKGYWILELQSHQSQVHTALRRCRASPGQTGDIKRPNTNKTS